MVASLSLGGTNTVVDVAQLVLQFTLLVQLYDYLIRLSNPTRPICLGPEVQLYDYLIRLSNTSADPESETPVQLYDYLIRLSNMSR